MRVSVRPQEGIRQWLCSLALLAVLVAASSDSLARTREVIDGRVVGVTDGDTVTVLDAGNRQHEVRLAGIDAPETSCHAKNPSPRDEACVERGQPFGKSAKRSLSDLVYGKPVRVALTGEASYGRMVGIVYGPDGVNANYEQVRRGYAWVYDEYAKKALGPVEYARFRLAQNTARTQRHGLWADSSDPISPWEYRRAGRGR